MAFYPNDMLTSAYLVGAVNDRPSKEHIRQQYAATEFLPWENVPERQVIWDVLYATNDLAGFYDPRGQAVPMSPESFATEIATLADVKASMFLEKWSVQIMRDAGMPAVYKAAGSSNVISSIQQRVKDHINNRLAKCNEVVDSQVEYIGMQMLQGSIVWPPVDNDGNAISNPPAHWNSNYAISISTGLPSDQVQDVTTLTGYSSRTGAGLVWTDASATPFNDLDIIQELVLKNKGINLRGGTIVMDSITLGYLSRNTSVLNTLQGSNTEQPGARLYGNVEAVKTAIKSQFGWNFRIYDAQWTYNVHNPGTAPTVQRIDFLTQGKVLVLPPGDIGTMMTAPQESSPGGAWVWGKTGWSHTEPRPPYDVELGVNLVCWPRFTYKDWFVLDTTA